MFSTKVNLFEALQKAKRQTLSKYNADIQVMESLYQQANKLLEDKGKEDLELLKNMGFGNAVERQVQVQEAYQKMTNTLYQLESERIFSLKEIEEICATYRLRFLPTEMYRGALPPQIITEMRALQGKAELAEETITPDKFFIVAPAEVFSLETDKDPLLFYQLDEDLYYLVCKWGNDLSAFRKILYWPLRTTFGAYLCNYLLTQVFFQAFLMFLVWVLIKLLPIVYPGIPFDFFVFGYFSQCLLEFSLCL